MSEQEQRAAATVIGLGPMGRALARALLAAGHETTVWNRTPAKAAELVNAGAHLASQVDAAVAASPLTVISVLDYDVADELLGAATASLHGRAVVNLTSDAPARARRTASWVADHGGAYLDGAIMTPTYTIGTPDASILVAGPGSEFERRRATLLSLGGNVTYLGDDPGRAAAYDMALLDLFWTTVSGYVHALALADAEGVSPDDLLPHALGIAGILPPIMSDLADRAVRADHADGTSSILSARAAMAHIRSAASDRGLDVGVLSAAKAVADRAIADGHSADDLSRLVETVATMTSAIDAADGC